MKMNVILFTSSSNKSGGSRQALYLAQGMAERGHNVLFFVPEGSGLTELSPESGFWRFLGPKKNWRSQIEAAMPKDAPAVVHAFHNAAVKRAAWWGLFWKKRAVTCAHRGVIFRPGNPLPYWSPGIDRFLVNSMACARVLQSIGLSPKRIEYVPNSVPDSRLLPAVPREELRREFDIPASARVFLCIGGNKPYKGVAELIKAFALAFPPAGGESGMPDADSPPHLIIVGVDPELWLPSVSELGMEKRIHLTGRREDIGSFLAASTVFVLPSLSESMPNTLLEAVRAGLPSVGTKVGAVPDILAGRGENLEDDAACGILVPPADVSALAAAMRRLAEDEPLRQSLARNALRQGENYRPEKRLDLVEGIYANLLQTKGLL